MERELLQRIRAARAYAGLSQPELAQRLGVSQDTLKRIELGQKGMQGYELDGFIRAVAEHTGLPTEFFTEPFDRLLRPPTDPIARALLDAGGQLVVETGEVAIMPGHPLHETWAAAKPALEKYHREGPDSLTTEELDQVGQAILALERQVRPGIEERLDRMERTLAEFTATWAEEALPVIARLQSDGPPEGSDASSETSPSTASRVDERAG